MTRIEVLQRFLDTLHAQFYLEIGVEHGVVLLYLRVPRRVGVDPRFRISIKKKLFRFAAYRTTQLFEMPSDDFFARHPEAIPARGVDVAFVDGLHTYEQCRTDWENCWARRAPGGVVLLHDCNPQNARQAARSESEANGLWFGDVWKTVAWLRSQRPDVTAEVLDTDCGLAIITPQPAPYAPLGLTEEQIHGLTYADLEAHREEYLGLRPVSYLPEILRRVVPAG